MSSLLNTQIFFLEKMREASHIFSTKNIGIFQVLAFEILTKPLLTVSLVLNNWVQISKIIIVIVFKMEQSGFAKLFCLQNMQIYAVLRDTKN